MDFVIKKKKERENPESFFIILQQLRDIARKIQETEDLVQMENNGFRIWGWQFLLKVSNLSLLFSESHFESQRSHLLLNHSRISIASVAFQT